MRLQSEELLRLAEVTKAMPGGASERAIRLWISHGVLVNGQRIKLESIRVGTKIYSSREAIQRFIEACSGVSPSSEVAAAENQLAKEGY